MTVSVEACLLYVTLQLCRKLHRRVTCLLQTIIIIITVTYFEYNFANFFAFPADCCPTWDSASGHTQHSHARSVTDDLTNSRHPLVEGGKQGHGIDDEKIDCILQNLLTQQKPSQPCDHVHTCTAFLLFASINPPCRSQSSNLLSCRDSSQFCSKNTK
eukprot:761286-Hanusia_phi.AAC.7